MSGAQPSSRPAVALAESALASPMAPMLPSAWPFLRLVSGASAAPCDNSAPRLRAPAISRLEKTCRASRRGHRRRRTKVGWHADAKPTRQRGRGLRRSSTELAAGCSVPAIGSVQSRQVVRDFGPYRRALIVTAFGQFARPASYNARCSFAVPSTTRPRIHESGIINIDVHLQSLRRLPPGRTLLKNYGIF